MGWGEVAEAWGNQEGLPEEAEQQLLPEWGELSERPVPAPLPFSQ